MQQIRRRVVPLRRHRRRFLPDVAAVCVVIVLVAVNLPRIDTLTQSADRSAEITALDNTVSQTESVDRSFALCGRMRHDDCVIDGDTFRLDGKRIRIADIDAPEIHPAHCDREAALGQAAKLRLLDLLNAGGFELRSSARMIDFYGRELRTLVRGGSSIGGELVQEGLARSWDGSRHPWC